MIKSKRIGNGAMIAVIVFVLAAASIQAQTQPGKASKPVERSETIESASRRAAKAFAELVAKSSALTEKRMFKGFRLGSCQPQIYAVPSIYTAPSITTPPRAESAVSLCQP